RRLQPRDLPGPGLSSTWPCSHSRGTLSAESARRPRGCRELHWKAPGHARRQLPGGPSRRLQESYREPADVGLPEWTSNRLLSLSEAVWAEQAGWKRRFERECAAWRVGPDAGC